MIQRSKNLQAMLFTLFDDPFSICLMSCIPAYPPISSSVFQLVTFQDVLYILKLVFGSID